MFNKIEHFLIGITAIIFITAVTYLILEYNNADRKFEEFKIKHNCVKIIIGSDGAPNVNTSVVFHSKQGWFCNGITYYR